MDNLKTHTQQLLAADRAEEAIDLLLLAELDTPEATQDFRQQAIMQSAQYQHYRKLLRDNTEDFADLVRTRNKVNLALLELASTLPDTVAIPPRPASAPPQGVSENQLKSRLLWLVGVAKLVVVAFMYTLWESGSFTNDQFMATLTLLVPVFATYLSLMVKDQVARREVVAQPDRRVTRSFERMAYGVVVAYTLVLLLVINLRGPGAISFSQMNALLAVAESGLGVYVSQVILALFKKDSSGQYHQ